MMALLAETLDSLQQSIAAWERRQRLALPHAECDAVLTIHAGAGGTDAQARAVCTTAITRCLACCCTGRPNASVDAASCETNYVRSIACTLPAPVGVLGPLQGWVAMPSRMYERFAARLAKISTKYIKINTGI